MQIAVYTLGNFIVKIVSNEFDLRHYKLEIQCI